jgi:hypothetical protein
MAAAREACLRTDHFEDIAISCLGAFWTPSYRAGDWIRNHFLQCFEPISCRLALLNSASSSFKMRRDENEGS